MGSSSKLPSADHVKGGVVTVDQGDTNHKLDFDLYQIKGQLQVIVEVCEETPSVIDGYVVGSSPSTMDIETMIIGAYRVMKMSIFAEDSQLLASSDIREGLLAQREEFLMFYSSALKELEIYKEVLQAFNLFKSTSRPLSGRGNLELIRENKRTHVDERHQCISAVSNFYGKFSAMLAALDSALGSNKTVKR